MANQTAGAQPDQKKSLRKQLFIIVLAAFAIRMVVVFFTYRDLPDADKYYEQFGWEVGWVARALASGRGYSSPFYPWSGPTALVAPLYTYLLAGVFRVFGIYTLTSGFIILTINSLLSSLTCIAVYFSAKYALSSRIAKYAAWTWAFYPFAIYFSAGRVWDYALTGLLFTTCFCIAQRIHNSEKPLAWLGFGALYGLTALSNPAVMSVLPFLLLLALWQVFRAGRPWFWKGVLTAVGVILVVSPWTVRNYRVLGIICPIRDNYWHNFYAGNFGDTSDPMPPEKHPASNPVEMQKYLSMGETAYLKEKHALAIACVTEHPVFFVKLTLRRVLFYWTGFWSFDSDYMHREPTELGNMFYCICVLLLMLRGAWRLWRTNREAALPYLVLIGIFPLAYYITHPLMDYRQPIEPAIVVLAVAGAVSRSTKPDESALLSR
jgi:4-amino-4-deoxy-L-arabinose transferase-like glycosyltransferase